MPKRTKTREPGIYSVERADGGKSYEVAYRNADGKRRQETFRNFNAARDFKRRSHSEVKAGTHVDSADGKLTLAEYYRTFRERQVWESGTFKLCDIAVKGCTFADVPLGKVRRSHVEQWVKTMSETLKPSTIRTRVSYVMMVVNGAIRDQYLVRDPMKGVPLPRLSKDEMNIPLPAEVGKLVENSHPHYRAFWSVCAFAGLRPGEAAGLKVEDIRWLQRELRVERQVQPLGRGTVDVKEPKFGSQRTVYIPERLVKILAQHVEEGTNGDWLFMGSSGNPPTHHSYAPRWAEALDAAEVGPYRVHDLRHFFASGLIAAGTDVVTVQRQLGHQSATVTLNRYSHLWNTHQEVTRTAVEAMMKQAMDSDVGIVTGKQGA